METGSSALGYRVSMLRLTGACGVSEALRTAAAPHLWIDEPEQNNAEHEEEADSAVTMAASDLYKIERIVSDLHTKIESLPKIEGWVAAKITLAADYLSSVHDWITHEMQADCGCGQDNSAEMFSQGYEDEEI